MLRSMTAYVHKSAVTSFGQISIEIHALNRKHLDVMTYLPSQIAFLDNQVRGCVTERIKRGVVKVRVTFEPNCNASIEVVPNVALALQVKKALDTIAGELDIAIEQDSYLPFMHGVEGLLSFRENSLQDEGFADEVLGLLNSALDDLVAMKDAEGKLLQQDIQQRLDLMRQGIASIAELSQQHTEKYRQKLKEKIEEVLPGAVENEDRLLREVCLFAEKADITEEVTRFNAHLDQIGKLVAGPETSVGKKMEFYLQEMLRESNTVASKSQEIEVSHKVVDIKSELEKIREQLQNVE